MGNPVNIRRAVKEDVAALTGLCVTLGYAADEPAMAARFGALAPSPSDALLVAEKDGAVIGLIQAHASWVLESGFRVEIAGLVVSADARRTGAGRALVAAAEAWARERGASTVVVRSNAKRVESHAFYPAVGYVKKKTQEVYSKVLLPLASEALPSGGAMATLVPMTEAEYSAYAEETARGYAAEKVTSGEWSAGDALRLGREDHGKLVPQGLGTPGHHFYSLRASATNEEVGTLWFGIKERAGRSIAYVYDIEIREAHRRKGHATRALAALEGIAKSRGLAGIQLHVFGHNPSARALYSKVGFKVTNFFMFKEFDGAIP